MKKELISNRNLDIDALRSFAIIYIVGFWHLYSYVTSLTLLLTCCVLGLFTFISGLLLATRYSLNNRSEIFRYYRRRFFRIYPLFFVALTGFLFMGIIGLSTYIKSALLTNMFIPEPLMTLWFITMLFPLYAVAPIFLHKYSAMKTIILTCALFMGLATLHHLTGHIDLRLPQYLVPFAFGIIVGRSTIIEKIIRDKYMQGLCFIFFVGALWGFPCKHELVQLIIVDIAIISSIPVFLSLGQHIVKLVPSWVLGFISYASFVMYLSHKILFALSGRLYHSSDLIIAAIYYGFFVLPATIGFSYFVQRTYDKLIGGGRSKSLI